MFFCSSLFGDSIQWYNGDPNLEDGLRQDVNGMSPGLTYDNFVVGPGGVDVSGLFSDDFMNASISQAYWEIRSGVSAGDGGVVVASGTSPALQMDLGLIAFGFEVYRIEVDGLSIHLPPGTYWMTVAPDLSGTTASSFVTTTSGTNGIGNPQAQDGNSYFNSSFYGADFALPSDFIATQTSDGGHLDFSEGVLGLASPVPEPGTIGLALGGLLLVLGKRRR
ncbi:MAG TPA: PEP-CTERM sorting domain-containing protein [Candidatus Sulfopaludibacter sp.]|nr:PEP-CTERM sorting domain-containing protein [Candidatus Sulfopaludibacter sp.]